LVVRIHCLLLVICTLLLDVFLKLWKQKVFTGSEGLFQIYATRIFLYRNLTVYCFYLIIYLRKRNGLTALFIGQQYRGINQMIKLFHCFFCKWYIGESSTIIWGPSLFISLWAWTRFFSCISSAVTANAICHLIAFEVAYAATSMATIPHVVYTLYI
jgi:hypothetical protein